LKIYFNLLLILCFVFCACQEPNTNSNKDNLFVQPSITMIKASFLLKYLDDNQQLFGFYKITGTGENQNNRSQKLNIGSDIEKTEIAIPPTYEDALEFSEGLAAVKQHDQWGAIDENNTLIIPYSFDALGVHYSKGDGIAFREGLAPAKIGDFWGYIFKDGALAVAPTFKEATCFSQGRAWVKCQGKTTWSLIDIQGKLITHTNYEAVLPFSEGFSAVLPQNNAWIYIDLKGKETIKSTAEWWNFLAHKGFEAAYSFSNGMAVVLLQHKNWGFINTDGKLTIVDKYEEALGFTYELAPVKEKEHWGFINKQGDWVIAPKYDMVNNFVLYKDGIIKAKVRQGDLVTYINIPK
jgi:hypothetical protein